MPTGGRAAAECRCPALSIIGQKIYPNKIRGPKEVIVLPQIISSIRSVKTDAERHAHNVALKSKIKTSVRNVEKAIESGETDTAKSLLTSAVSVIDGAATKGVIHKNAAARKKSSLVKKMNVLLEKSK